MDTLGIELVHFQEGIGMGLSINQVPVSGKARLFAVLF